MILIFGGTTEGRKAAEVLEEAGALYFYSTKTGEQELTLHHGQRIDGALDGEAMQRFCQQHDIRLIVDAAHPFASMLHETIANVAETLKLPVVRYERIYPPRASDITWIDDYSDLPVADLHGLTLLATTGVQSICKLKWLETRGVKVRYRILNRKSSIELAYQQGVTDEQLCYYEVGSLPEADVILLKESGLSGGFEEKVAEAREKGMRIIALKRPKLSFANCVDGPYGLRRTVERLLPDFFPLHSGLTTGTCATAAMMAATMQLTKGDTLRPLRLAQGKIPTEVPVLLPNGETIHVAVGYGYGYAYCIKEAGDDPDVTNGVEIRVAPFSSSQEGKNLIPIPLGLEHIEVYAGEGIGRFTLPGFDYPPGEPAINKGPRAMMRQNLEPLSNVHHPLSMVLSIPNGAEIARKTFNPRLGIEGGISIIGVSGIVMPFSEEAFIDSIRKCMEVAKASGSERVVINSGAKSERYVKALYPELPQQAFVEYGNYIGETLKIANELDIQKITLGVMLGKAVKLAQGHLDTHSRKTVMDKNFIRQMLEEAHCTIDISSITLARELWERIPACGRVPFAQVVIHHSYEHCKPLLPDGSLTILLIDDEGKTYAIPPSR